MVRLYRQETRFYCWAALAACALSCGPLLCPVLYYEGVTICAPLYSFSMSRINHESARRCRRYDLNPVYFRIR